MIPREYTPKDSAHAAWVRDASAILSAAKTGFRWADQIGKTISFTWNDDNAPMTVLTSLTMRPLAVMVLGATTGDGSIVSCPAITWAWIDGSLSISAIGTLTASTDYTVTLGLVR